jgi:hypothetical protein
LGVGFEEFVHESRVFRHQDELMDLSDFGPHAMETGVGAEEDWKALLPGAVVVVP